MSQGTFENFKETIQEQVENGDIKLALDQLRSYLADDNGELEKTATLLTSKYNQLVRDNAAGVLMLNEYKVELAKISQGVLNLSDLLPDHTTTTPQMGVSVALPSEVSLEKIIGTSNLQQIAWLEQGLEVAKPVCRIILPNDERGTGFLIAPDLLMTNAHVIPTPEVAEQALAEFNYQNGRNGVISAAARYKLDPTHFHASPAHLLDYAIVRVKVEAGQIPLTNWGHVEANTQANPVPNEHVIIIQHPLGGLKQIALTANQVIHIQDSRIRYTTDTMPGSSGAPVFNDSWQVVALHHAGGELKTTEQGSRRFLNEGILVSAIRADAGSFWP